MTAPADLAAAYTSYRSGRFKPALAHCNAVLKQRPNDGDALHLKGMALFQLGRVKDAIRSVERAVAATPGDATAVGNLGRMLIAARRFERAEECFRKAAELNPAAVQEHAALGNLLCLLGRLDEAADACGRALELAPADGLANLNMGVVRFEQGRFDEAVVHFEAALRTDTGNADARTNIGFIRLAEGRRGAALTAFDRVLAAMPDHVRARTGRARTLFEQGEQEAAIAAFQATLALDPRDAEANFQLGVAEARRGDDATGEKLIGKALALDPAMFMARWKFALLLPRIYESSDHVKTSRARWFARVEALEAELDLATPEAVKRAVEAIKTTTNFDLHYQGHDDRPLQELYARILSRVAAARYPDLAARPERRLRVGKLRVGFVSSFLYDHTIFKIYNAWITDLTDAIETYVYYLGKVQDSSVDHLRDRADVFEYVPGTEQFIAAARGHELDVLIYLDLGMEPRLQIPAALWLAPVQCNGMGHPVTSGLPSITHVLTSALMEPPGADAHYTETLVRLPGTSLCYRLAPIDRLIDASSPLARENDRVRFLCAQNLQKYLPAFDHVFPDIAAGAPNAEFHFISDQSSHATERFRARIAQAFAARNISADDFCRFHPRLDNQAYMSLNLGCDIFLDNPMWSGNNTTHEAVACGLPVITWPGPMMRGRHAAAICAMLNIGETVARDIEDYVALAIRAANDAAWCGHLRDEIATHRERLFDDSRPVRALESFLIDGTTDFDDEY